MYVNAYIYLYPEAFTSLKLRGVVRREEEAMPLVLKTYSEHHRRLPSDLCQEWHNA